MPAVSFLVLAILTQPIEHQVAVLGRGGEAFWATGARGNELWERVRGDVRLEARRPPGGAPSAELSVDLIRNAERWSVELSALRPGSLLLDADLLGPGGLVHAAVALGGTARVTRGGELVTDAATVRALALTTGFHADDGTFRTLPAGRSGDLELLIQLDGLPDGATLDLGFEHPEITLDGRPIPAAPLADATAPAWPGAHRSAGVGGSGTEWPPVASGSVPALPPPPRGRQPSDIEPPSTPGPEGAMPAAPLPSSPSPGNSAPASPLPPGPAPSTLTPVHGSTDVPGPTWFPSSVPTSPVPEAPIRECGSTRVARSDSKIDPSGQASTVRVRAHLRARNLDLSRNLARIALADGG